MKYGKKERKHKKKESRRPSYAGVSGCRKYPTLSWAYLNALPFNELIRRLVMDWTRIRIINSY